MSLKKKVFENIVEKGENGGSQHFLSLIFFFVNGKLKFNLELVFLGVAPVLFYQKDTSLAVLYIETDESSHVMDNIVNVDKIGNKTVMEILMDSWDKKDYSLVLKAQLLVA